jgi:hypothetical protein
MRRPSTLAALVLAMVASLAGDQPAAAINLPVLKLEPGQQRPEGFRVEPRQARLTADRVPEVLNARRAGQPLRAELQVPRYFGDRRYEVVYLVGDEVKVDVHVSGRSGRVFEVWTGPQANDLLARGYEPSVGRSLNELYIWLPLALLFLAPFVDPRRPFRILHLDLLVLLGFGVSQIYFNRGDVEISVPLVYPLLGYLLVRLLLAGLRPRERRERLVPFVPVAWLLVGLVALVGFRIVLNGMDSHVMDIGMASVIGADRIDHGEDLYAVTEGADDHGDTYGPVNYVAYLPFEAIWQADGDGGAIPAARAAAVSFDLLVIGALLLLGGRLRGGREGRMLGLAMAYAWASYPFSLYALQANTNDGLVAALLVLALVALSSPPIRGALLGLAAAAKFAPLALAPLLASGRGDEPKRRAWPLFGAALGSIVLMSALAYLPDGGLRELYDATIGYQLGRESPFSIWGLHQSLSWLQDAVKLGVLALAVAVAFVPKRRDARQVSALAAAVLIAAQLTVTHWFYFYIVWFAPLALGALFGAYRAEGSIRRVPSFRLSRLPAGVKRTS